ncbi:MAG: threonine synthase [Oscillospiraceae bacterium]|nr:threonine synthase [Oscillospiraceae bacterium]
MLYHSTRSDNAAVDSAQAVLEGLAPDGGLYMPVSLPNFDWKACLKGSSMDMATAILSALLPDIPNMPELVKKAYTGKFETEDLTPTVCVGDFHVLELFRGPTSAFKDVALSMLPQLLTAAKTAKGMDKDILILTATSGDTGKAALEGFHDVDGIRICVFYPYGGVSQVQRAQMVTQEGSNVAVCAVYGNFDDAQTGVKNIFAACQGKELPYALSSANSINIGRLAPQVMYYFRAYRDLLDAGKIRLGDEVNFSVPTGNFGDILAGYLAKKLGLPVGKLICASNANNVLTDFITTGTYDKRRPLLKTTSPSMDILVSSNLERLLYLLSGDTGLVAALMKQLNTEGFYTVPDDLRAKIQAEFCCGCCDDQRADEVMGRVYRELGYLCDPHTAAGWAAAEDYTAATGDSRPMVVLSTASPYKFPVAVLTAIGGDTSGDEFQQMERLSAISGVAIPKNLAGLQGKEERHPGVIEKDAMLDYVLNL